ncbi:response regulator transcription factor, partial [Saccharothrix sp. MB29]|nr:response regulator transcription factor [Saccharothrix sp. MB29]
MVARVFLVDDHEVVRVGVRELLNSDDELEVVGEAGSVAEALARVPGSGADVAVLDVRLPDGDGVTVCREIRSTVQPPPACLMLTSYSDDEALFGAIMAGAAGYMLKQVSGNDLVSAIRTLAAGGSLLHSGVTATVLQRLRGGQVHDVERRAGDLGQRDGARRGLALQLGRPGQAVLHGVRAALRERLRDELVDRDAVLGVHHDRGPGLAGLLHGAQDLAVGGVEDAGVGHEHLERVHARVDAGLHLLQRRV